MINPLILIEIRKQLHEIIGQLALVESNIPDDEDTDDSFWIERATAQLVGLVQGLNIIIDHPLEEEDRIND